ncbi:hypothetical protein BY996DRAFT_6715024 [Phakopsora pachyrhizi]|nr:hypothetical protein BY996DRAFT_6715024 [Phakopsora pachyrhizi]
MILLLFNEMKLLAFVGDFFTPMLFFLLFFYSHPTILCSSSSTSLSCTFCSSVLLSLCCPYPVLIL